MNFPAKNWKKNLKKKINLYTEYERLFNDKNIPFKMLGSKLKIFTEYVNNIFQSYTQYRFEYSQTDTGRLAFNVSDSITKLTLEPERLSGYESIILQLAINQAVGVISSQSRSGFMLVDESLDCIDQLRFIEKLPEIVEAIRKYYQTILLISHRDVPVDIIDKQLKIAHNNSANYSTIYSS